MPPSIRNLALIAISIPSGVLAENQPIQSRVMWSDAPVIMTKRDRGNWRREKRIWEENVYPIGNGRLGATIFGEPQMERIQFNEDSLWVGNEDNTGGYQPFGDVHVALPHAEFSDYRRELDISRAVQTVRSWNNGKLSDGSLRSLHGQPCRLHSTVIKVTTNGKELAVDRDKDGVLCFKTLAGVCYAIAPGAT